MQQVPHDNMTTTGNRKAPWLFLPRSREEVPRRAREAGPTPATFVLLDLAAAACVATLGLTVVSAATFGGLACTRALLPSRAPEIAGGDGAAAQAGGGGSAWVSLSLFVAKSYLFFHVLCRLYVRVGLLAALAVVPAAALGRMDSSVQSALQPIDSPLDALVLFLLLPAFCAPPALISGAGGAAFVYFYMGYFWRACPSTPPLLGLLFLAAVYGYASFLGVFEPLLSLSPSDLLLILVSSASLALAPPALSPLFLPLSFALSQQTRASAHAMAQAAARLAISIAAPAHAPARAPSPADTASGGAAGGAGGGGKGGWVGGDRGEGMRSGSRTGDGGDEGWDWSVGEGAPTDSSSGGWGGMAWACGLAWRATAQWWSLGWWATQACAALCARYSRGALSAIAWLTSHAISAISGLISRALELGLTAPTAGFGSWASAAIAGGARSAWDRWWDLSVSAWRLSLGILRPMMPGRDTQWDGSRGDVTGDGSGDASGGAAGGVSGSGAQALSMDGSMTASVDVSVDMSEGVRGGAPGRGWECGLPPVYSGAGAAGAGRGAAWASSGAAAGREDSRKAAGNGECRVAAGGGASAQAAGQGDWTEAGGADACATSTGRRAGLGREGGEAASVEIRSGGKAGGLGEWGRLGLREGVQSAVSSMGHERDAPQGWGAEAAGWGAGGGQAPGLAGVAGADAAGVRAEAVRAAVQAILAQAVGVGVRSAIVNLAPPPAVCDVDSQCCLSL